MIIGLSGRKNTGKTTLSELLINRGYERASFATPLKEYVAKLFDWEVGSLYTQKGKEEILNNPVFWNKESCKKLEDLAQIKLNFIDEKKFNSRRDALQYIGTDVLRAADPDFHVKRFAEKFFDGDYVIDDVRFLNEVETLRKMNGVCVHVVRPYNWVYSNHDSEISISRRYVEYFVLNDTSQQKLVKKFDSFLNNLFSARKKPISRMELFEAMNISNGNVSEAAKYLKFSKNKTVDLITKNLINIDENTYKLNHDAFSNPSREASYWAGIISSYGKIKKCSTYDYSIELSFSDIEIAQGFKRFILSSDDIIENKGKYNLNVLSPYIIDDLKLWNIEPIRYNHVPDIIRNNEDFLMCWLTGFVDGNKNLEMDIVSNQETLEFVKNSIKIPCVLSQDNNLFNLRFSRLDFLNSRNY